MRRTVIGLTFSSAAASSRGNSYRIASGGRRQSVQPRACGELFDVGGSMDYHIKACEELFSAARSEFKHMDYYYFHNCLYESVWRKNERRWSERVPTYEVLNTYPADYKVIFVGDASISPYEVLVPGGLCGCGAQSPQ